jgi:hypothetical protein
LATAPRPGSFEEEERAAASIEAENKVILLNLDGETHRLVLADLGPREAVMVRKLRVGRSLAGLLATMLDEEQADLDVPCILVWLARVKAGENRLTFDQVAETFPTYADVGRRFDAEIEDLTPIGTGQDIPVDVIDIETDEDDSPEA